MFLIKKLQNKFTLKENIFTTRTIFKKKKKSIFYSTLQKCQSKNKETKNQRASLCERNLLADTSKIVENKICKCKEEDCRKVVTIRAQWIWIPTHQCLVGTFIYIYIYIEFVHNERQLMGPWFWNILNSYWWIVGSWIRRLICKSRWEKCSSYPAGNSFSFNFLSYALKLRFLLFLVWKPRKFRNRREKQGEND